MRDRFRSRECALALKALADPDRLKIVQCLLERPRSVSEVAEALAEPLANVSHHLAVLRKARLVRARKQGKFAVYSLHPDTFRPAEPGGAPDRLDLGCCRLELTGTAKPLADRSNAG
jgi:DNA-binding transcriptional ArsR family regulator